MELRKYQSLLVDCEEFKGLVNAHKDMNGVLDPNNNMPPHRAKEISLNETDGNHRSRYTESVKPSPADQLIKKEKRETGDAGFKPYLYYLRQKKGLLHASFAVISHMIFIAGQIAQNSWMAANVQNPHFSTLKLISVYIAIGVCTMFFLLSRSLSIVALGMGTSRSLFSQLLDSVFRAPMFFFDTTPIGRVLSRVSSDFNIIDLDVPFAFMFSLAGSLNAYSSLGVLVVVTWEVLLVSVPMIILANRLQRYYLASAKELMRVNGTTKSTLANHIGESISGAITIRAFQEEDRFFATNLDLIDKNASPYFYNFAATEWLIQRLDIMSAAVLSFSSFVMVVLPRGTFSPANQIISVERVSQYTDIQREAAEVVEENRPAPDWPKDGNVEFRDLKVLDKCQLLEAVQEKGHGLDSHVAEDGSNWSMGQRQLFSLGRALLKRLQLL